MDHLQHLQTEARNPASDRLDELTSLEFVELMSLEDAGVPAAVLSIKVAVAQAIEVIADRLGRGGRLIYCGAGTSGRLGVLDASECPPTFQTNPEQVIGLIAGGPGAMFKAVEGAEDSPRLGEIDLEAVHLTANDVVCGIATSGRTPYVIGAVRYARKLGAFTLGLVCTPDSELEKEVDLCLAPLVGPEVLTGSTRLKAGTATKLVLNTLTTGAMVRLGKTFGNLMVDLKATNTKLVARANRIVRTVTGADAATAEKLLTQCGGEVKTAIVAHVAGVDGFQARAKLAECGGRIKPALAAFGRSQVTAARTVERPVRSDLVIGIDGGGSNTVCLLAKRDTGEVIGRGVSGPSNIQSVGVSAALEALNQGIDRAFQAASLPPAKAAAVCLGLAGVDRQEGLDVIHGWAARENVADSVIVSNDATLLLAAGTPDGWGLAVIAGTGSIAFVQTPTGEIGRCGGWGHLLGDEGSAYRIALAALRAACRSFDGIGPKTALIDALVKKMSLPAAPDFIPAVYRGPWDRAAIAGLAPVVLELAVTDTIAAEIVRTEATDLARTAAGAVAANGLPKTGLPVALAGGLLTNSEPFCEQFLAGLRAEGVQPGPVKLVSEPAVGAVVLARNKARG
ncbi:MAG: N-acetylmuramic acid 6-phosphate etherase [Gemmataceae bacterium]